MSTREQARAARAFATTAGAMGRDAAFRSLAAQLPAMLSTNGFLATMAFLLAKGKPHHLETFRALVDHLESLGIEPKSTNTDGKARFRTWVDPNQGLSGGTLRRVTKESIALAVWLKRAAQASEGA